jgi:hypothetical protein
VVPPEVVAQPISRLAVKPAANATLNAFTTLEFMAHPDRNRGAT